ncbi:energy-coupled thiamine transporter ThiT [Enterococcus sp. LJL98]
MHGKTRVMVEGTIIAALAIVLSFLPTNIGSSFTISLGQIPLTLYALRRGLKPGLMAGFIWGILHFPIGNVAFLSVPQVLIEYLLAFLFAGFAGIYAPKLYQAMREGRQGLAIRLIVSASLLGVFTRFFWHFVAGWVFWGEYAMWGMSPALFSLVMNGVSALATGLATSIALVLLYQVMPNLFSVDEALPLQSKN